MPNQALQRLQTSHIGSGSLEQTGVPSIVHDVLQSAGQPLDLATRAFMEPRFGHDFARVRVHTNDRASQSAEAVGALAYTVGNHIVFGAGQHQPGSARGQHLLAHELTHAVQQENGVSGKAFWGRPISHAPIRLSRRLGPPGYPEEQEEERKKEAPKREALRHHEDQQRKVAGFMDNARKIQPDPKKGLRDPDNLFRNTVELLDGGKLTLTILAPTHSKPDHHFDTRVRFDAQGNHFGGDYPAVPIDGIEGVVEDTGNYFGKVNLAPPRGPAGSVQTLPPKVEQGPAGAAPAKATPAPTPAPPPPAPFAPGDIFYFTRGMEITEAQFKNTFVHEGQHIADLSPKAPLATSASDLLENYKSEFRAFWIQPPMPRTSALGQGMIDTLPEPTGKADNSRKVRIAAPDACKICKPANASTPAEVETKFQNPRQKELFWHILSLYQSQQYDCCYVFDKAFHNEVNRFAFPESVNLINSERLMKLNLEIRTLNSSTTPADDQGKVLVALLAQLDPLDWMFLKDRKLSKPFWDALKASAPGFVKGVTRLADKAAKGPLSATDVNQELSRK